MDKINQLKFLKIYLDKYVTKFNLFVFIFYLDLNPQEFENILNNIDSVEDQGSTNEKKGKAKPRKSLKFSEPVPCGINQCKVIFDKQVIKHCFRELSK